jgi:hypothetical protein
VGLVKCGLSGGTEEADPPNGGRGRVGLPSLPEATRLLQYLRREASLAQDEGEDGAEGYIDAGGRIVGLSDSTVSDFEPRVTAT